MSTSKYIPGDYVPLFRYFVTVYLISGKWPSYTHGAWSQHLVFVELF